MSMSMSEDGNERASASASSSMSASATSQDGQAPFAPRRGCARGTGRVGRTSSPGVARAARDGRVHGEVLELCVFVY